MEVKKVSPVLLIVTGAQEIGKSYTTLKQAIWVAYKAKNKAKALIFDTNNEYGAYKIDNVIHNIGLINHNEITEYSARRKNEVRRITPFIGGNIAHGDDEDKLIEQLLLTTVKNFKGGDLVIEDLSTIFGDNLPKKFSGVLCNVRHRNCNISIHLQSVGRILPKMRQNAKIIRYHYQLDSIRDSASKLKDEAEIFYIVEKLVNTQFDAGNKYFHVYVYRMIKKVKGEFSPKMFAQAIEDYIYEHPETTMLLEKRRDAKGNKMYTYDQAVQIKKAELFKKYYGNLA